ncbi:yeats family protein [Vararia minispora EC-137]|uniref:Yeats family protein n=1 Tax=Vararia minispora EC-137 TaxID=1314806 RepID=A0ACB8QNK4_9AGAM|nr:yeats family protein [Vararia minispora EC-137]
MTSHERVRVKGIQIHRPVIYGNTAVLLTPEQRKLLTSPDHTHRWTVAVRSAASSDKSDQVGGADDITHFIKRVSFKLHETYPNPLRNVEKAPFEVTETGWGEFEIQIKITFVQEAGERTITLYHHLKLHPWTATGPDLVEAPPPDEAAKAGPVHSWQYDEVVFTDPYQNFLNTLTLHPPTSLPRTRRKPVPFHLSNNTLTALEASKGGTPEFNKEMEMEERARLERARQQVLAEREKILASNAKKERELEQLKKDLGD